MLYSYDRERIYLAQNNSIKRLTPRQMRRIVKNIKSANFRKTARAAYGL